MVKYVRLDLDEEDYQKLRALKRKVAKDEDTPNLTWRELFLKLAGLR